MQFSKSGIIRSLSGLVFPNYCPECHSECYIASGWVCETCWQKLTPPGGGLWAGKTALRDRLFVAFHYGDLARKLVHQMKFYGRIDIAQRFGLEAAGRIQMGDLTWPVKAIVPVPLHPARVRERGYDQNLALAKGFAAASGLPVRTDLLVRIRHTAPQSRLSDRERLHNLGGAFRLNPLTGDPIPDSILLIDDVIHTGATVSGCLEALPSSGGIDPYVLAVCG